eukprot:CAMPEP_0197028660 /NCGR_PEP_ID=MMETSP1384-20130603/8293_1 /TAXON_ID=29189 /ORGANISM="Ammonia sp." /LENGTH=172 /DNA_ID=CAMNT_0042457693 /DNA_START=23 /DNA_END=541 /DNA_ORIENTATION=+
MGRQIANPKNSDKKISATDTLGQPDLKVAPGKISKVAPMTEMSRGKKQSHLPGKDAPVHVAQVKPKVKQAMQEAYNLYDDIDAQSAYIPEFSYSAPSYYYRAPTALGYESGAASTDYVMIMALIFTAFLMICLLCFVVNMVMAAGCFIWAQRQSSKLGQTKYRSNMVEHEEV